MRKETFRGLEEEQLSNMPMEDYMKICTSRLRRTLKRLNQNPRLKNFIKRVREIKAKNPKKLIKTQIRDAIILPEWLGLKFAVHNGKDYKQLQISVQMLGHTLGDFAHTTFRVLHSGPGVGATRGSKFVPLK